MKLGKSVGFDNIPAEVLRNDFCIDMLYTIIKFSFQRGVVPGDWLRGIISPIPKGNNDQRDPLSFRPITLISIPCKIYANILNKRLTSWIEINNVLCDEQNGFRRQRSCQDHIYALYNILNCRKLEKKDTFACFVDAKKAFDTVNRDCLWYKLLKIGIHGHILSAIKSLYMSVSCTVRINDNFTEWFNVNQGVKQGCVLSPTLFSIYINDLATDIKNLNCGLTIDNINISIFLYADDIVLISENANGLQSMLNVLNDWCCKWRITVNENKTKVLHFRNRNINRSNVIFKCGEKVIDYESDYKYLGFWFNDHLDMKKCVKEIAKSASRALSALYMKFLNTGGMSFDVYKKLFESVVEPVMFYCAGIWGYKVYS